MDNMFHEEIDKFRKWALDYPVEQRSGEWECDYPGWDKLNASFITYLDSHSPEHVTQEVITGLIYAVARDNEIEWLISQLAKKPAWFRMLLPHALICEEPDARWQFADALGNGVLACSEAEEALLKLVEDGNEYVSRIALQGLGKIKSTYAESLCERAWETNDEYQRMMALWVLKEIHSEKLPIYLARAREDGREYLTINAREIENGQGHEY